MKDSGIGIPAERVATIFRRFGKVNDFVQGTGLGLTLCRMLVEKMGGRIWLRSQVNPEKPDVPLNKNDAFQKVQKRHVQEKR